MNYAESFAVHKGAWNATKGLLWKILCVGGERRANRAWMIYSLAKALVDVKTKKNLTAEPEEGYVRQIVKPGHICLDIGANIGSYTHLLSTLVGVAGEVHSIEPIPSTFAVLSKRMEFFRLNNVRCYPVALGEHVGVGKFIGGTGRPGDRYFAHLKPPIDRGRQAVHEVPLTTLDRLVAEQGIEHIDFVKCDVEGSELMVFRGGQNVLTQYRPTVLCEVEGWGKRYGHETSDIFHLFCSLGYDSCVWHGGGLSSVDGVLPHVNNYIFLPQERVGSIVKELRR